MPLLRRGYLKYVGNSPYSGKSLYTFINPLGINSVPSADSQIDYTLESKRKEQLTKLIEAELKTNPKLSESEAVQKFATKFVPEDLVSFCFDIAKNHVELERQKKETPTEYMKRRNKEKHEQGQPTALEEEKGEAKT